MSYHGYIVILKNHNKYHPAFIMAGDKINYRINSYHNSGFEKKSDAIKAATEYLLPWTEHIYYTTPELCFDRDILWDGKMMDCKIIVDSLGLVDVKWKVGNHAAT